MRDYKSSTTPLKTVEILLLPSYLGRHSSKIWMRDILPEVDPAWLVAANYTNYTETNYTIVTKN